MGFSVINARPAVYLLFIVREGAGLTFVFVISFCFHDENTISYSDEKYELDEDFRHVDVSFMSTPRPRVQLIEARPFSATFKLLIFY